MSPSPLECQGADAIGSFLREFPTWRSGQHFRLVATRANTQPAFGVYRIDAHAPVAHPSGLIVLTLQGGWIATISNFIDSGVVPRFWLPRTLPG